jgi:hypothetical protein
MLLSKNLSLFSNSKSGITLPKSPKSLPLRDKELFLCIFVDFVMKYCILMGQNTCHSAFKDFFSKEKAKNLSGSRPFLISSTR